MKKWVSKCDCYGFISYSPELYFGGIIKDGGSLRSQPEELVTKKEFDGFNQDSQDLWKYMKSCGKTYLGFDLASYPKEVFLAFLDHILEP